MTDAPPSVVDLAIARARDGRLSMQSVLWLFAASTVYVPNGANPGPDRASLRPVYYSKDGTQMLAVFTSPAGATTIGDLAHYLVSFGGADLCGPCRPPTDRSRIQAHSSASTSNHKASLRFARRCRDDGRIVMAPAVRKFDRAGPRMDGR